MNCSISVKQADVVLVTYPLSYMGINYSQENSLDDHKYYAAKQSQDGPGLTYAIFSIVASEVSPLAVLPIPTNNTRNDRTCERRGFNSPNNCSTSSRSTAASILSFPS
jgi:hypothetical protein